jgi:hypothetical protein
MNKKITSIIFLFIIVISAVILYGYLSQPDADENKYNDSAETIDEEDIENEFNDFFLDEDDEVEIGDMI